MKNLWLIKIGEISLKKGNRAFFERLLKENIKRRFDELNTPVRINIRAGRYYVETDIDDESVSAVLKTTPGIVSFSRAVRVKKELDDLFDASLRTAEESLASGAGRRFKFEVRRTDKGLPMDSYGYAAKLGGMILHALPELTVDVHQPDFTIKVELREWGYVYGKEQSGPGGLPVGTGGRAMLLLSGGIDSPVAGYLMAKRGMRITAIHFHTPPFTGDEAHDKVVRLAGIIAPWCGGLSLLSIPFTDCQVKINQSVDPSTTTLHTRACMMQIAELWSEKRGCGALITGEALGQVASQTMESIAYTDGAADLPVFRPLVGMDKEEIIALAREIGTFETATEPFDDCCTVFSPEKPLTRPKVHEQRAVYESIEGLDSLMDIAVSKTETVRFDGMSRRVERPS